MSISILGAGAFGSALACALGQGSEVILWDRDENRADLMQTTRRNMARLPDAVFPKNVTVTAQLDVINASAIVLLCVPMQQMSSVLAGLTPRPNTALVACCKGVEILTGLTASRIIQRAHPEGTPAVLTGPSFAVDIAKGLPTALTLACENEEVGAALQSRLSRKTLRLYRTTDVTGAELGGALKNIVAIGCGAAIGAGLGDSARASLMTRGFAEITAFAATRGADPRTLAGLSGLGDLALTCTSDNSRNYRYGMALGAGEAFDPLVTVEGAATAQAVTTIAQAEGLEMPVTRAIAALTGGQSDVTTLLDQLLNRPLKEE